MKELISGTSVNSENRQKSQNEKGVLKTSAVGHGRFYAGEHKAVLIEEEGRLKNSVIANRIIISRMNTPNLVGESGYVDATYSDLFLPDRLWMTEPSELKHCTKWLAYCLQFPPIKQTIQASASGTSNSMKNISKDNFLSTEVPMPPLTEQKKIARILSSVDSKLALIDQQITTTQTLKKGLMQKLFTQGVGTQDADGRWQPHTEFQETELGRIPVGWKCLPLSKVARISSGGTPARGEPSFWNGEIPWVTTGEIFFNTIFKTKENITVSGQENSSAKLFPVGTVLMAMYGQGKTRGQVAKLGIEATTNQACAAIMPYKGCDSDYLYLYLEMTYQKNRQSGNEGSQKNLNAAIIKSFMIPLAPFDEQQEIARILSTVDRKLNHLHTQKTQTQQLKKGLMQKLLTGQIRVQPDPQDT